MAQYRNAKLALFSDYLDADGAAVINADDEVMPLILSIFAKNAAFKP